MPINPAIISSASALFGALAGGSASLAAAIYTQRTQDRLQRLSREFSKRETVYADFIMSASRLLVVAQVSDDLSLGGDEQQLVGLLHRMRLFAPDDIMLEAEEVIRSILKVALQPGIDLKIFAADHIRRVGGDDPLLNFSLACRKDLDSLHIVGG